LKRLGYGIEVLSDQCVFSFPGDCQQQLLVQQAYDRVQVTQRALDSMTLLPPELRHHCVMPSALRILKLILRPNWGRVNMPQDLEQRTRCCAKASWMARNGLPLDAEDTLTPRI